MAVLSLITAFSGSLASHLFQDVSQAMAISGAKWLGKLREEVPDNAKNHQMVCVESQPFQVKFLKVVQQHPSLTFMASAEAYKAKTIYYKYYLLPKTMVRWCGGTYKKEKGNAETLTGI